MHDWLEKLITRWWNGRAARRPTRAPDFRPLDIGHQIVNGEIARTRVGIDQSRRAESVAIIGKTGAGKSSLIRHFADQDVSAGHGFALYDQHGDEKDFVVKLVAKRERVTRQDLSDRLIVVDPTDPDFSIGLNPLEVQADDSRFMRIAEVAKILKDRWHLETFGARTDELLRNALFVLSENNLTLVELGPLLGDATFRSHCLKKVSNAEVVQYFELRYNPLSDAMRHVMSEPILNKTSAFVADPRFRHIVGQRRSTFSLGDAIDRGCWVLFNLHKGKLGEQSAALGSLFFATVKYAIFAEKRHQLFTLYCDEIQNLVAFGGGLETVLAEIRKFGSGIVSANQNLEQLPAEIRAAILAVGSHIFFQLSGSDAQQIATVLDGGKPLAEQLKNLPRRHAIVKTVHERWREAVVPIVHEPEIDPTDLLSRSRARWARTRQEIENDIRRRQVGVVGTKKEALDDWE